MSDKPKRVAGYDFALSLAIFSMVVVNYSLVMGATQAGPDWLAWLVGLLPGRAAVTFVMLAGGRYVPHVAGRTHQQ